MDSTQVLLVNVIRLALEAIRTRNRGVLYKSELESVCLSIFNALEVTGYRIVGKQDIHKHLLDLYKPRE